MSAVALALSLVAASLTAAATPAAATNLPVPYGSTALSEGLFNYFFSPGSVPGANNWSCKPTAAHPYPVILVPGTGANVGFNWVTYAPALANAGYCVYSFNYGQTISILPGVVTGGLGDIAASAQTLSSFVNQVLGSTGAHQVDLVGHSQGGMMPNYYLKFLGGAPKVHTFVGLAPSNHGTTLDGIVALGNELQILGLVNSLFNVVNIPALAEQEVGSPFETNLFAGGDTVAGPRYVVLETTHDEIVTPYTQALLKGSNVTNIILQDQCRNDTTGHLGMFDDGVAVQDTLAALGSDTPTYHPSCTNYGFPL
jgi:triacylglycerol esterase/lipase EstA (alpha/beta hydrolase family)